MNLRQLEILRSVLRCRTTIGAARELGMSQPAVSHAIQRTEAHLGFRLFDRINNRLVPTEEARILFAESEPLFSMHQSIKQKAMDLRDGRSGRIRLVATSELSQSLVPPILSRFSSEHPDVKIALDTVRLDSALEAIELNVADIGLAIEPHPRPALTYQPLLKIGMVLICPMTSPLAEKKFVTPADLADQRLIFARTTSHMSGFVEEAFRQFNVRFSPAVEVRFLNVAAGLVEAGLGVAIVDELTISSGHYSKLIVRPFRPQIGITISAVYAKDRTPSRLTRIFLEHARAEIRAAGQRAKTRIEKGVLAAEVAGY
jgi:DNA-binding transcriptional LysR family regulator